MKKQVKISDVKEGQTFYTDALECVKRELYHYNCCLSNSKAVIAVDVSNRIIIFDKMSDVYIDVPAVHYRDIKIGEPFKIGQSIYFKVNNMMTDRLSTMANPCVCVENNFLYHCDENIEVERVDN